jgi:osmotically inducible protein OsmC
MPTRTATTHWEGDLATGSGTVSLASSGVGSYPVSFPKRAADTADGTTSPEELVAAAHSSCFSMALSHELASAGNAPTSLDVTADVTLGQDDTGFAVTTIVLTVTGVVPGIDADAFTAAAEGAKAGCPISKALAGVADISVVATLA